MASLADRTIAALRTDADSLFALVATLSDEQLEQQSAASDWSVASVLSHLGSQAELGLPGIAAARAGEATPGQEGNQAVWDRWNAMSPRAQADGFVEHLEQYVSAVEDLTPSEREGLKVDTGFLPFPLSLAALLGMRLNEVALHGWDVQYAFDPTATVRAEDAELLAEHFAGELAFLLGFTGKADQIDRPVELDIADSGYGISIGEAVSFGRTPAEPTATFHGSLEAALRLLAGRLREPVEVTGNATLDDLRKVFPGY
jgi:uncharacterized protein (TIGR03083 family)